MKINNKEYFDSIPIYSLVFRATLSAFANYILLTYQIKAVSDLYKYIYKVDSYADTDLFSYFIKKINISYMFGLFLISLTAYYSLEHRGVFNVLPPYQTDEAKKPVPLDEKGAGIGSDKPEHTSALESAARDEIRISAESWKECRGGIGCADISKAIEAIRKLGRTSFSDYDIKYISVLEEAKNLINISMSAHKIEDVAILPIVVIMDNSGDVSDRIANKVNGYIRDNNFNIVYDDYKAALFVRIRAAYKGERPQGRGADFIANTSSDVDVKWLGGRTFFSLSVNGIGHGGMETARTNSEQDAACRIAAQFLDRAGRRGVINCD